VANTILLVCAVLGTVTSLVSGFIGWDNWRQEKRDRQEKSRQTPERGGSDPAPLADVKRRSKMWWGLTGIAAAVAIGGFLGWRVNQGTSEWTVQIHATQDWTDTGADCTAGSVLEIAATGTITHRPDRGAVGPGGNPDPKARGANVKGLRNVNHAALIASIDGQPPYFLVGKKKTYICDAVGRLFLGINDNGVDNNSGKFVARIKERTIAG
jgi:hypothetical protein